MSENIVIKRVSTIEDATVKLFNDYRIFYRQNSDIQAAKSFLEKRLDNNDSIIFIAEIAGEKVGFTQLYPSFSSVGMVKKWTLNDLYVNENFRQNGIAESLINHVLDFAKNDGAISVHLSTEKDNSIAQSLYNKIGFEKTGDSNFINFKLILK